MYVKSTTLESPESSNASEEQARRKIKVGRSTRKKIKQIGANVYFVKFLLSHSIARSRFPFPEPTSDRLRTRAKRTTKRYLFKQFGTEEGKKCWAAVNRPIESTKKNSPSLLDTQIDRHFGIRKKGPPKENEVFHAICLLERYFRVATVGNHPHWELIAALVKPLSPRCDYSGNTLSSWVAKRRQKIGYQDVNVLLLELADIYNNICR